MSALLETRLALANATQRAGRAGRVRKGECYHLFMAREEAHMAPQQEPEMRRVPLESLCLRVLNLGL